MSAEVVKLAETTVNAEIAKKRSIAERAGEG